MIDAHRRAELHPTTPALRRLGMNSGEDDQAVSGMPLHHGRRAIGIPADYRAPSGELKAILPILIERWRSRTGDRHCRLADAARLGRVEAELHARGQIQT